MKTAGVKDDENGMARLLPRTVTTKKGRQKIEGQLLQFGEGGSFTLAPALSL